MFEAATVDTSELKMLEAATVVKSETTNAAADEQKKNGKTGKGRRNKSARSTKRSGFGSTSIQLDSRQFSLVLLSSA